MLNSNYRYKCTDSQSNAQVLAADQQAGRDFNAVIHMG
jgi:hypothetical protein